MPRIKTLKVAEVAVDEELHVPVTLDGWVRLERRPDGELVVTGVDINEYPPVARKDSGPFLARDCRRDTVDVTDEVVAQLGELPWIDLEHVTSIEMGGARVMES
jgi:hypothetical protein